MIECIVPFETFQEGNLLIACLYLMRDYEKSQAQRIISNSSLFVQVHGHIYINRRWINQDLNKLIVKPIRPVFADQVNSYPIDPRKEHNGYTKCFFASSKIPISAGPLVDQGVVLECELPFGLFPSFKGRAVNISYYITLTIQGSSAQTKSFHYPILVAGTPRGKLELATQSYQIQHASLVGYALTSIPIEYFTGAPLNYDTESVETAKDLEEEKREEVNGTTWFHDLAPMANRNGVRKLRYIRDPNTISCKISDNDHICTIYIGNGKGHLGKTLPIFLDFSESRQTCYQVTASLILVERRSDDVLVQEKVIAVVCKATQDADELFAEMRIPSDTPTTFSSTLIKVEYKLLFEFELFCPQRIWDASSNSIQTIGSNNESLEEPLSFHIPLPMIFVMSPKNMFSSSYNDYLDNMFTKHQLISLSLENRVFKPALPENIVNPDPLL